VYQAPRWLPHSEDVRLSGKSASPTEAYVEALADERTRANQHLGQRKLLISEVQMLTAWYSTEFARKGRNVHPVLVYVGAAPGSHDLFLHRLFPHVRFVLYDGALFDPRLGANPAFELRNEYFTDAHCAEMTRRTSPGAPGAYAGRPLLFVCDIRSDAPDDDRFESQVMRDMASQQRWVALLKPELSLLKFRLPYTLTGVPGAKVPYLKGRLLWGVWATKDSGETRLLVKKSEIGKTAVYDYADYEGAKTFHNHYTRRVCFADAVPPELAHLVFGPSNPFCSCFDCLTELVTYKKYIEQAAAFAFEGAGGTSRSFLRVDDIVRAYDDSGKLPMAHSKHAAHSPPAPAAPIERLPFAKKPVTPTATRKPTGAGAVANGAKRPSPSLLQRTTSHKGIHLSQ
jgi:hypothetical protein